MKWIVLTIGVMVSVLIVAFPAMAIDPLWEHNRILEDHRIYDPEYPRRSGLGPPLGERGIDYAYRAMLANHAYQEAKRQRQLENSLQMYLDRVNRGDCCPCGCNPGISRIPPPEDFLSPGYGHSNIYVKPCRPGLYDMSPEEREFLKDLLE
jgi:hypothetical protein